MKKYKYISSVLIISVILNLFFSYAAETENISDEISFDTVKKLNINNFNYKNNILSTNPDIENAIGISETFGEDFSYEADILVNSDTKGSVSLIFKYNEIESSNYINEYYMATINFDTKTANLSKLIGDETTLLTSEEKVLALDFNADRSDDEIILNLKVVTIDNHISLYINGLNLCNTYDYINNQQSFSESNYIKEGYVGISSNLSNVIINDIKFEEINNDNTPYLNDIELNTSKGDVEKNSNFKSNQLTYQYYVSNEASSVKLKGEPVNKNTKVTFIYQSGEVIKDNTIALLSGQNVVYALCSNNGITIKYRINIYRRNTEESYYYEDYRNQYHYSAKDGYITDIAGLVKIGDTYHSFYEYSTVEDANNTTTMWSHASSKDLIKWEEKPIAFYSDEQGQVLSSTIVYDENNTSGLFDKGKNGLVSIISVGSKDESNLICAYSEDEGNTWIKTNGSIISYSDSQGEKLEEDEVSKLYNPQVFRYEEKWFMITSGEQLTIYSSNDLLNWTVESEDEDIKISNATLFRTEVTNKYGDEEITSPTEDVQIDKNEEEKYKWVLMGDNNNYKIGEFTNKNNSDEKYTFEVDEEYKENNGTMNYGNDVNYSTIYYTGEFTDENTDIKGMSLIDCSSYVDDLTEITKSDFEGVTSLVVNYGIYKNSDEKYQLIQNPIEEYEKYYTEEEIFEYTGLISDNDNNILEGLEYSSYLIEAKLTPQNASVIGLNVLMGENEKTAINYYTVTKELSIDRSNSGNVSEMTSNFNEVTTQTIREDINEDGSIDIKIYVDKSTVEVYLSKGNKVFSYNVYPSEDSNKMELYTIGGDTTVDIKVTPINTIWDKVKKQSEEKPTSEVTEKPTQAPTKNENIFSQADIIIIIIVLLGMLLISLGVYIWINSLKAQKELEKNKKTGKESEENNEDDKEK